MPRFAGQLVEEEKPIGPRFGGTIVDDKEEPVIKIDPVKKETTFIGRLKQRLDERQLEGAETGISFARGEITAPEVLLQVTGKAVGLGLDFIGEFVAEGYDQLVPDVAKDAIGEELDYFFTKTPIGIKATEAINGGVEQWEEFKAENPRAAKNIESATNILFVVGPIKGAKPKPSILYKPAKKLAQSARRTERMSQRAHLTDLIKENKVTDVYRTTEEGILKQAVYNPSKSELKVMAELKNVPGLSANKSYQGNFNAIQSSLSKEANFLKSKLSAKEDIRIKNVLSERLKFTVQDLKMNHPAITGTEAHEVANKIAREANIIIAKNAPSPKGLLKSRQELDFYVKSAVSEAKAFGDGPWAVANKRIREMINQTIDDFSHNVAVKKSLSKQNKYYTAMDRVAPKAFAENKNAITRLYQKASKLAGARTKLLMDAALVMGTTSLAATQMISGPAALTIGGLWGTYKAGKMLTGPKAKKFMSALLKATDESISQVKDPKIIKQLRADRAALIEMINSAPDDIDDIDIK